MVSRGEKTFYLLFFLFPQGMDTDWLWGLSIPKRRQRWRQEVDTIVCLQYDWRAPDDMGAFDG